MIKIVVQGGDRECEANEVIDYVSVNEVFPDVLLSQLKTFSYSNS
jgi:hypothetical protein